MSRFYVIIPASGHGKRFQHCIPKQYLTLSSSETVLEHCVQAWRNIPDIEKIVVVIAAGAQSKYPHPQGSDVMYAIGGAERAYSVAAGLEALSGLCSSDDWVFVHDAARPIFSGSDVQKLKDTVEAHPVGGILTFPVRDTLRHRSQNGQLITVPRDEYSLALTPQLFRYGVLKKALAHAIEQNKIPTDEAQAIEWVNLAYLTITAQFYSNKITYPEDFPLIWETHCETH